MVLLISGASHTGKTVLAQKLLEQLHYPYLSMDHLKMGLIRSGQTCLTPCDDEELTDYLWPIVREMIKTAIENHQNLIVEGCYIPFNWKESFEEAYLEHIRYCCLIMTDDYIDAHFEEISCHANDIEQRLDDSGLTKEWLKEENRSNLAGCRENNLPMIHIDRTYDVLDQVKNVLEMEIV